MSYYEDIGVAPNAPIEGIHDQYRTLVKLFHPDQHADPSLKAAAEAQLRRFNQIYSVLSDPDKRRHYNAELAALNERLAPIIIHTPRPVPARPQWPWSTIVWVTAVVGSVALVVWLSIHENPLADRTGATARYSASDSPAMSETPVMPATPPGVTDPATRAVIEQLRQQVRTAVKQRDDAWKLFTQLRQDSASPHRDAPVTARAIVPTSIDTHPRAQLQPPPSSLPSRASEPAPMETPPSLPLAATSAPSFPPVTSATPAAALNIPASPRSHFAGSWVLTKPGTANRKNALYPPEFIETTIVEQNGSLHGKYRARYRVADRSLSPNVNFEFDGKASGGAAQFPFSGDGGARGEVKIRMISDTSMELRWSATDLGNSLGLATGTAVLVRKAD